MTQKCEFAVLVLMLLLVASLFPMAKLSTGAPSTPEYTVHYVNDGLDKRRIEVIVKNQLFTPYIDEDGNRVDLYYFVRYKGHFSDWGDDSLNVSLGGASVATHDSSYTILTITISGFGWTWDSLGLVDVEVKAFLGYSKTLYQSYDHIFPLFPYTIYVSHGESAWGYTQTVYIGADAVSFGPFDDVPFIFCSVIAAFTVMIASVIVILARDKRKNGKPVNRFSLKQ